MNFQKILDPIRWSEYLDLIGNYDSYHTYEYHEIESNFSNAFPILFLIEDGLKIIGFPLIEDISSDIPQLRGVYGYPGPITNCNDSAWLDSAFNFLIKNILIIHPNSQINTAMNSITSPINFGEQIGTTYFLENDTSQSSTDLQRNYRSGHRESIKKLRKLNATVELTHDSRYVSVVHDIYMETMSRVSASEKYLFDKSYFNLLLKSCRYKPHIYTARIDAEFIGFAIFLESQGIIQYHLSGTRTNFKNYSPAASFINAAHRYSHENGFFGVHLGGGLGSGNDSLSHFKQGFNGRNIPFKVINFND